MASPKREPDVPTPSAEPKASPLDVLHSDQESEEIIKFIRTIVLNLLHNDPSIRGEIVKLAKDTYEVPEYSAEQQLRVLVQQQIRELVRIDALRRPTLR